MAEGIKRILVVDDEPYVGSAVQRELLSPPFVGYRYEVEAFTDPRQALERAREVAFDAVISDYRMPVMNGLEFLTAFAVAQPGCVRLVLSGDTDMEGLARLVNESHIYRFIPKPWDATSLKGSLVAALHYSGALLEHRRLAEAVRANPILALPVPEWDADRVLVVDDDPGVLNSLVRVLTQRSPTDDVFAAIAAETAGFGGRALQEDRLTVDIAPGALRALELAEKTEYACILSDFRMPDMDGIELLEKFRAVQPECARILISGQIGDADLARAIEQAHIFAFVDKPWTDFQLKAQVAAALSRRRLLRENRRLAELAGEGNRNA